MFKYNSRFFNILICATLATLTSQISSMSRQEIDNLETVKTLRQNDNYRSDEVLGFSGNFLLFKSTTRTHGDYIDNVALINTKTDKIIKNFHETIENHTFSHNSKLLFIKYKKKTPETIDLQELSAEQSDQNLQNEKIRELQNLFDLNDSSTEFFTKKMIKKIERVVVRNKNKFIFIIFKDGSGELLKKDTGKIKGHKFGPIQKEKETNNITTCLFSFDEKSIYLIYQRAIIKKISIDEEGKILSESTLFVEKTDYGQDFLVTLDNVGLLNLYNMETNNSHIITGIKEYILIKDNKILYLVLNNGNISIIDSKTGVEIAFFDHPNGAIYESDDLKSFLIKSKTKNFAMLMGVVESCKSDKKELKQKGNDFNFLETDNCFFIGNDRIFMKYKDNTAELIDAKTGDRIGDEFTNVTHTTYSRQAGSPIVLKIRIKNELFVKLINTRTGETIGEVLKNIDHDNCIFFLESDFVFIRHLNNTGRIIRISNGNTFLLEKINGYGFSKSGKFLVSLGRLIRTSDGKTIAENIEKFVFSNNEDFLFVLRDLETGELVNTTTGEKITHNLNRPTSVYIDKGMKKTPPVENFYKSGAINSIWLQEYLNSIKMRVENCNIKFSSDDKFVFINEYVRLNTDKSYYLRVIINLRNGLVINLRDKFQAKNTDNFSTGGETKLPVLNERFTLLQNKENLFEIRKLGTQIKSFRDELRKTRLMANSTEKATRDKSLCDVTIKTIS